MEKRKRPREICLQDHGWQRGSPCFIQAMIAHILRVANIKESLDMEELTSATEEAYSLS
jgi:hypothetical protein